MNDKTSDSNQQSKNTNSTANNSPRIHNRRRYRLDQIQMLEAQIADLEKEMRKFEDQIGGEVDDKGRLQLRHNTVESLMDISIPDPKFAQTVLTGDILVLFCVVVSFHAIALLNHIAASRYIILVGYTALLIAATVGNLYTAIRIGREETYREARKSSHLWSWVALSFAIGFDAMLGVQAYQLSVKRLPYGVQSYVIYILPVLACVMHLLMKKLGTDLGYGQGQHDIASGDVETTPDFVELKQLVDERNKLLEEIASLR